MSGEKSFGLRFGMKHVLLIIATVAVTLLPIVYLRDYGIITSIWLALIAILTWGRRYGFAAVILGFGILTFPALPNAREPARQSACLGNMRFIAVAIWNYESDHGHFPPAYLADENGVPMHSWRVLILPYVDSALYRQYDFNEPWDGPNNRKLADRMPTAYRCPSDRSAAIDETSYVAVLGNHTMWPYGESRRLDEIKDRIGQTILLVENDNARTNWMKPVDIDYDDVFNTSIGKGVACISSEHLGGLASVCFVDARNRCCNESIHRNLLKASLTVDGGEELCEMDY